MKAEKHPQGRRLTQCVFVCSLLIFCMLLGRAAHSRARRAPAASTSSTRWDATRTLFSRPWSSREYPSRRPVRDAYIHISRFCPPASRLPTFCACFSFRYNAVCELFAPIASAQCGDRLVASRGAALLRRTLCVPAAACVCSLPSAGPALGERLNEDNGSRRKMQRRPHVDHPQSRNIFGDRKCGLEDIKSATCSTIAALFYVFVLFSFFYACCFCTSDTRTRTFVSHLYNLYLISLPPCTPFLGPKSSSPGVALRPSAFIARHQTDMAERRCCLAFCQVLCARGRQPNWRALQSREDHRGKPQGND